MLSSSSGAGVPTGPGWLVDKKLSTSNAVPQPVNSLLDGNWKTKWLTVEDGTLSFWTIKAGKKDLKEPPEIVNIRNVELAEKEKETLIIRVVEKKNWHSVVVIGGVRGPPAPSTGAPPSTGIEGKVEHFFRLEDQKQLEELLLIINNKKEKEKVFFSAPPSLIPSSPFAVLSALSSSPSPSSSSSVSPTPAYKTPSVASEHTNINTSSPSVMRRKKQQVTSNSPLFSELSKEEEKEIEKVLSVFYPQMESLLEQMMMMEIQNVQEKLHKDKLLLIKNFMMQQGYDERLIF